MQAFEEVVYLLWHGKLPNKEELSVFSRLLAENAKLPQEVIDHFKTYPIKDVHPMAALKNSRITIGVVRS